ncbi:TPA: DNA adenine methylase, partial [Klebsiella michiganensis]|nr:DNA adenine methylase [Klebsiella michiganensis]HCN3316977.1 DNA adenine methylase [Klebsiella michiganensis]HCN3328887.1 DNA adenine methylase [Klebsiella michiganensis]HCN3335201.1 DNA adenine methylase [Klebsiella michiganensis]
MSYLGSKAASGVYQKIIAEMPPHDVYIETHLGGGAVMLR